jgi:hypothetical protein
VNSILNIRQKPRISYSIDLGRLDNSDQKRRSVDILGAPLSKYSGSMRSDELLNHLNNISYNNSIGKHLAFLHHDNRVPTRILVTKNEETARTRPLCLYFGLFEGRDPAPHFDIDFFTDAAGRGHPDIKIVLYEALTSETESVPLNPHELRKRQDKFYESISLRVERELTHPAFPFLVFIQASDGYQSELLDEARGFDLMLNYYDEAKAWPPTADYVLLQMGTKATAVRKILQERPEFFGYHPVNTAATVFR